MAVTNAELFRTIQAWATENYPGIVDRICLKIILRNGDRLSLPILGPAAQSPPEQGFAPNKVQAAILEVLEGKALKTGALARETGYTSSEIFRDRGGMKDLQDRGLVQHGSKGFYLTNAPPLED